MHLQHLADQRHGGEVQPLLPAQRHVADSRLALHLAHHAGQPHRKEHHREHHEQAIAVQNAPGPGVVNTCQISVVKNMTSEKNSSNGTARTSTVTDAPS